MLRLAQRCNSSTVPRSAAYLQNVFAIGADQWRVGTRAFFWGRGKGGDGAGDGSGGDGGGKGSKKKNAAAEEEVRAYADSQRFSIV